MTAEVQCTAAAAACERNHTPEDLFEYYSGVTWVRGLPAWSERLMDDVGSAQNHRFPGLF